MLEHHEAEAQAAGVLSLALADKAPQVFQLLFTIGCARRRYETPCSLLIGMSTIERDVHNEA
jgi:hypothetical protein